MLFGFNIRFMTTFEELVKNHMCEPVALFDRTISRGKYTHLNLSVDNVDLKGLDIIRPEICQHYISSILEANRADIAFGGYLEHRNLYSNNKNFLGIGKAQRTVHLGIDFWTKAGTAVLVPFAGKVHSFKNNVARGDYGPTIILVHEIAGFRFHTLYGHLSKESLQGLEIGKTVNEGYILGTLGNQEVNGNYAPHLHFQIVIDMTDWFGDYPGVCAISDISYYSNNCPNPNLVLNL